MRSLRGYSASPEARAERAQAVPETPLQQFSAQKAVWWFVRDFSDLDETEREELSAIRQASSTADIVYELVQDFMGMIRRREGERLDAWLENVRSSQIPELQKLVRSIKKDKAAVLAGLTLSHNSGQVEGQNTKLKLIKRMMYGRAGLHVIQNTPTPLPMIRMINWKGKDASRMFRRQMNVPRKQRSLRCTVE